MLLRKKNMCNNIIQIYVNHRNRNQNSNNLLIIIFTADGGGCQWRTLAWSNLCSLNDYEKNDKVILKHFE